MIVLLHVYHSISLLSLYPSFPSTKIIESCSGSQLWKSWSIHTYIASKCAFGECGFKLNLELVTVKEFRLFKRLQMVILSALTLFYLHLLHVVPS